MNLAPSGCHMHCITSQKVGILMLFLDICVLNCVALYRSSGGNIDRKQYKGADLA